MCSASKLSCIDCGQIFGRQDVEGHTQCITEAEKYGPKGQGKVVNGSNAKPSNASNLKPDIDISVGLSERPPWFCSLCNTKATSKQTLLLHADGKKHRAKARAFHAANQKPKQSEGTTTCGLTENCDKTENQKCEQKEQKSSDVTTNHGNPLAENGNVHSGKKRKPESSENGNARKKSGVDTTAELGNGYGEVIQVGKPETEKIRDQDTKSKDDKKKIKWKKLITSILKSNPEGAVKLKKLKKLILVSLKESGIVEDKNAVNQMLAQKINSSSRFSVDGKYVLLAAKS